MPLCDPTYWKRSNVLNFKSASILFRCMSASTVAYSMATLDCNKISASRVPAASSEFDILPKWDSSEALCNIDMQCLPSLRDFSKSASHLVLFCQE